MTTQRMAPFIRFRDALLQEHVTWPDREVVPGDSVFFELSASVARYHAPLTRMAYVGEPPDGTEVAGRIAADALDAVTAALVPGRPCLRRLRRLAGGGERRDSVTTATAATTAVTRSASASRPAGSAARLSSAFARTARGEVQAGMTFHVLSWLLDQEPADYVLSDTVLVTPEGGQLLTSVSRDPIVVPS